MTFGSYSKKSKKANSWICSKNKVVDEYNSDELCGYIFTTNGFINLYKLMKESFETKNWRIKNKDLKIYIIAGREDPVIQNKKKFEKLGIFIKSIGYKNVELKLYPNMKHEILNEKENKIVYQDILNFIENKD